MLGALAGAAAQLLDSELNGAGERTQELAALAASFARCVGREEAIAGSARKLELDAFAESAAIGQVIRVKTLEMFGIRVLHGVDGANLVILTG